jgi:hypothetical protein
MGMKQYSNSTFGIGAYADEYAVLLPVIPCTESILFLADATSTTTKSGKCAKAKYGDIYNTIISNFAMVQTDDSDDIKDCMREAYQDDDEQNLWECFFDGYTRMGGDSVSAGPNFKKPSTPTNVEYDSSDKASYVLCVCYACVFVHVI